MATDDDFEQRFAEKLAELDAERVRTPVADTPMWLSHHWPARYDRCVVIGGRHVCRRCVVLYPVAVLLAFAAGLGVGWPDSWDVWVLWLLPIPGVVEFVLDTWGVVRHNPIRQVVVSALLAVAYGKILWRFWQQPFDGLVWAVVLTNTGVCGIAALLAAVMVRGGSESTPTGSG